MQSADARLEELKRKLPDLTVNPVVRGQKKLYWYERILSQLQYGIKLSRSLENRYDDLIERVIGYLSHRVDTEGALTVKTAQKAEEMLSQVGQEAKKRKVMYVAHSHIDMNWMWGWDETVSITLDTFRTMLMLMKEYPLFKFSQSQAAVYRIVEKYDPAMLEEIRQRVSEGRWEVAAATWVEADKNMPNAESMARHILYTKKYLANLLPIDSDSLCTDFEPDTFGHSAHLPDILNAGGVKYYYHCRGFDKYVLYRWIGPAGGSILVYRDADFYNVKVEPSMVMYTPEFCKRYGVDTMLKVYGVGDHGGGPTRGDIERIMDMDTWPVFPKLYFGTYAEYFSMIEKSAQVLPEVKGELNYVSQGCYTSQSKIKMANRVSEAVLNEAELFSSMSACLTDGEYSGQMFQEAWENVLFNQFHDILPGSCTVTAKEHAMGLFQETTAIANTRKSQALRRICSEIDTSGLIKQCRDKNSVSEGAGVGYGTEKFSISQYENGNGKERIYHVFNPSPQERQELVEITVWDWDGDLERVCFRDAQDNIVEYQLLDAACCKYWAHNYFRVLIKVSVPACGYNTYIMTETDEYEMQCVEAALPRFSKGYQTYILENSRMKVTFDPENGSICSMIDKETGEELIDARRPSGIFRLVREDGSKGGTAWAIGSYMSIRELTDNVRVKKGGLPVKRPPYLHEMVKVNHIDYAKTPLRQSIIYEMTFGDSSMKVEVSLDADSSKLNYHVECNWQEVGSPTEQYVPQLNYYIPVNYHCTTYKYDIPGGTIRRQGINGDVPGTSWALAMREEKDKKCVMVITKTKYGFRGNNNALGITLIHSSYDPDPYPEVGIHTFDFAVALVKDESNYQLIQFAYDYNHPMTVVTGFAHEGCFPVDASFMKLEKGSIVLTAVKMPEHRKEDQSVIVRFYETDGDSPQVVISFNKNIKEACFVDINERELNTKNGITIEQNRIVFGARPYQIGTVQVVFY